MALNTIFRDAILREGPWRPTMVAIIATALTFTMCKIGLAPEAQAETEQRTYTAFQEEDCRGDAHQITGNSIESLRAAGYKSYKILGESNRCRQIPSEGPLDLGTTTVIGRRITPSTPSFGRLPSRLRSVPPIVSYPTPANPQPQQRQEKKKEESATFHFSICSRPLGGTYEEGLSSQQKENIRNRLARHDDVAWETGNIEGSAGFFSENFKAAALFSFTKGKVDISPSVPSNCVMRKISKAKYIKVIHKVNTDWASPPHYHLIHFNCQAWAAKVAALTFD